MKKYILCLLLAASPLTFSGCSTLESAQVTAEKTLAAAAQAKKVALDIWAQYVVSEENRINSLDLGESRDKAVARLHAIRAKVQNIDSEFQVSWNAAFDLALANANTTSPAAVTKLLADLNTAINTFRAGGN
jgi:hypothetical protein